MSRGRHPLRTIVLACLAMLAVISGVAYSVENEFSEKSLLTPAKFMINGKVLATKSAFVVLTDEFFAGRTRALKILFHPEAISADVQRELVNNAGATVAKTDHVYLILFLDKSNQLWQVNFTSVLPGETVGRTIAWQPEELKRMASGYAYDGKRLKFRNGGSFHDQKTEKNPASIEWKVDFDLPVFESASVKK